MVKICINCNKEYITYKENSKFCSADCKKIYGNVEHQCARCGKKFMICRSRYEKFLNGETKNLYCSKACHNFSSKTEVKCTNCGKKFLIKNCDLERSENHFCCKDCLTAWRSWSEEDDDILRKYYVSTSFNDIAKMLSRPRSESAISHRALRLGLNKGRYWSEEEVKIVRMNYSNIPLSDLCKLLPGRTKSEIKCKAVALGIPSYWRIQRSYSDEEDSFIKENYLDMTNLELSICLGRTKCAIASRISYLGLHRPKEIHNYLTLKNYVRKASYAWAKRIRRQNNYTCCVTGRRGHVDVHHIYGFCFIFEETIEKTGIKIRDSIDEYSQEELDLFMKCFFEIQEYYHEYCCVSHEIHQLFHTVKGRTRNTRQQWDEFVKEYNDGKYDDLLNK